MKILVDDIITLDANEIETYINRHSDVWSTEHIKMFLPITQFYLWWLFITEFEGHKMVQEGHKFVQDKITYNDLEITFIEFKWWRHPAEVEVRFQRAIQTISKE